MAKHVQDIDKGFKAFQKFLEDARNVPIVKIGVLGTPENLTKDEGDGYNQVQIAAVNEYGTKNQNEAKGLVIPPRSFIGSTMDEKKRAIGATSIQMQKKLFLGELKLSQALGLMGKEIKNLIQGKITSLRTPPNKPSTIKKKGSSNPLIDNEDLRKSISYEVDQGSLSDELTSVIAGVTRS